MIEERINIVPILAAEISKDRKTVTNIFDTISYKKGSEGFFYIDFVINALINKKYLIKYILFRRSNNGFEALAIDDFVLPPDEEFLEQRNAQRERFTSEWAFSDSNIISAHTITKLDYKKINLTGNYGILAFGKKFEGDDTPDIDEFNLSGMELICEKHFYVNVEE